MGDFTAIETQEAFDAAIKKRLEQQERVITERFSGYISPDELTTRTEELTTQISNLGNSLEEATQKADADAKTIKELEERIKSYETASVKSRVAHEVGLPFELANRLSGTDEDAIRQDAEALKKSLGTYKVPAPPVSNPNGGTQTQDEAFRQMLSNLT